MKSRTLGVLVGATLSALSIVVAAQGPVPEVELLWGHSDEPGLPPGGNTIYGVAGSVVTLDVYVNDGGILSCVGLSGAKVGLVWDPNYLTGLGDVECPSPPAPINGTCVDYATNVLYGPLNPGVSRLPGSAQFFDAFALGSPGGYRCGDRMHLGKMSFLVQNNGSTTVSVDSNSWLYSAEVNEEGNFIANSAVAEATVKPPPPPGC